MKTIYRIAVLAPILSALALAGTMLAQSFSTTNCIGPTNSVTGWPTNSVGTNGLPQGTGGPINLGNNEWVGFYFQAYCATNIGTAGNIVVTLIRSASQNPPGVSYGTNVWTTSLVLNAGDWETWSNSASPVVLTIPVTVTNYVCWFTNLDRWQMGGAQWIGVCGITNSATNSFLTNMVMGLSKKIIPIRYP